MLELMRKHAGSWMIKILLGAIVLAFALSFGVYSYYGSAQEVVLKVNEEPITMSQVREEHGRLSEQARQQLGEQYDRLAPMLDLRQRAIDRLVERALLFQAAGRLGITVSHEEVRLRVASFEAFQRGGQFDLATYQRVLSRNRMTPEGFEEIQRNDLILEKLSILVAGSAQVTPLEVEQELARRLTKVAGAYRLFDPQDYLEAQKAADQEIETYYQAHKADYLEPEKIQLRYLAFPLSRYRDQADVRPEDVKEFYEINRDRFARPERVRARHILIKLEPNATEAQAAAAQKLAGEILKKAQAPGADFAKLAQEHSQGPTASRGGDLGWFRRGQMVPAFEQKAFSLKPGEMDLVQSRFGWHVIKVEDHQEPSLTPFEEVRGELTAELTDRQAGELASAAAERAFDQAVGGVGLDKLAGELSLAVDESPLEPKGRPIPGLKGLQGLAQASEGISQGQVLPVMSYDGGSVLAVLAKVVPEAVKPLAEVREEVALAVREKGADQAAKQAAAQLLDALRQAPDPAAKLEAHGGGKTGLLERGGEIEGLEHSGVLAGLLFQRPQDRPVLAAPAPVGDKWAAAVLTQRQAPSEEDMTARREEVKSQLLLTRRREIIAGFVQDLRAQAAIQQVADI